MCARKTRFVTPNLERFGSQSIKMYNLYTLFGSILKTRYLCTNFQPKTESLFNS